MVDAFVAKLDGARGGVVWCTYLGGSGRNSDNYDGGGLAVDPEGRAWISGMSNSRDFPMASPLQRAYGGGDFDGFVAGLSSDGSQLCYSSYYGGGGRDILEGITARGRVVYLSGLAASRTLAQRRWWVQGKAGGGPFDAMVLVLQTH